ncbi:MAG: D-alanyl-D-alanine carboxypeptidase family protein [Microbacteriaceae bacterium]
MTSDDTTPAHTATTRRAMRSRRRSAASAAPPVLSFDDDEDGTMAPAGEVPETAEDLPDSGDSGPDDGPQAADAAPEDTLDDTLIELEFDSLDTADEDLADVPEAPVAPAAEWADENSPATALTWLETADVVEGTRTPDIDSVTNQPAGPELLTGARQRPALLTARWLAPIGTLAAFVIAYAATTLLWPLHAVPPVVEAVEFETTPAAAAEINWPAAGSSGVGIAGVSSMASTGDAASIASLTKVVTSLMVLDRLPLQLGEQGPEYAFTYGDSVEYWDYRRADQSALDVPVDGVLTEYQLLQGTLLGSANNYIDYLARDLWGSDQQFASAAEIWLAERGLSGITVVTPSGFDEGNVATPEALLKLGERAMQNPVFAEIVGTAAADIPGAGRVENTNGMLADPGVVGIKTGTLVGWSLLTAKDVTIGDTTIHLYAATLNQANNDERLAATRSLFSQVEDALADLEPAVPAGTVVGEVNTIWGTTVDIVSDADATVLLWNDAASTAAVDFTLDDQRAEGDGVGTLTVNGPVDAASVDVSLADELSDPSPWWRLTHPLDLFGING